MSQAAAPLGPLGVFGGTFNPIHYGHLRSALELVEHLGLAELRLMPCAVPPHRGEPECAAQDRAAMVQLAVAGEPSLSCDARELSRPGKSYTIDSLKEMRGELGADRPLCLVMGCDALLNLDKWHRWRELLEVAHIVVIARPGWAFPTSGELADWLRQHRLVDQQAISQRPCGGVLVEQLRPLSISSTEIRELLSAGKSVRYLLPEPVLEYIRNHSLYCQQRHCTE